MVVWIFQTGEPLHCDLGSPRAMRCMNLANQLLKDGHSVVVWSAAFHHQEKRHRSAELKSNKYHPRLKIRLIKSCGYNKNIGLMRFFDHAQLAYNLKCSLDRESEKPDFGFVGYPPIEFAWVAIRWLDKMGVQSMLDIKDQWPSIMVNSVPRCLSPIARIILIPYYILARQTMKRTKSICSMSSAFLRWTREFSRTKPSEDDYIAPLAPNQHHASDLEIIESTAWWERRGIKNDGRIRLFFVGSLSRAFNFKPIALAARAASISKKNWQIVICGNGDKLSEIKSLFKDLDNVLFPGWVDFPKISLLAGYSHFALAPYKNSEDFLMNVPNKIIDYLAMGKPIFTGLHGEVGALVVKNQVGCIYDENSDSDLFNAIEYSLWSDRYIQLTKNVNRLYRTEFAGDKVYSNLVKKIESMVNGNNKL